MERRMALAVAAAGALISATGVVGATGMLASSHGAAKGVTTVAEDAASVGSRQDTTTSLDPVTVTETRDVFDMVVVPTQPPPPAAVAAVAPMSSPKVGDVEGETAVAPAPSSTTSTTSAPRTTTTTTAPRSAPATTTTTVRSTRPPMPAGCIGGQLEDNGTWNCQSPESHD